MINIRVKICFIALHSVNLNNHFPSFLQLYRKTSRHAYFDLHSSYMLIVLIFFHCKSNERAFKNSHQKGFIEKQTISDIYIISHLLSGLTNHIYNKI